MRTLASASSFYCLSILLASSAITTSSLAHDQSSMRVSKTIQTKSSKKGESIIITWGIVPDGTGMPNFSAPRGAELKSNFVASMDKAYGGGKGTDYSKRPWFNLLNSTLQEIELKSGVTYVYVPYDDGSRLHDSNSKGVKNKKADLRLGGLKLGANNHVRGYSGLPVNGETPNIVFNTNHPLFKSKQQLDYLFGHELMHNLGMDHIIVNGDPRLTAADNSGRGTGEGPQFDDLLGIHSRYGDTLEKDKGNNTAATAFDLGTLTPKKVLGKGFDASGLTVKSKQTDFVSIHNSSDVDYYKFVLKEEDQVTITLTPRGPKYNFVNEDQQSKPQHIDASQQNNLLFSITNDQKKSHKIDSQPIGKAESITTTLQPGNYSLKIEGEGKKTQFYSIEIKLAKQ